MTHQKLVLIGFGNVARSLVRLLMRKQSLLEGEYGITFSVTGIATGRHGFAADPRGLEFERALALVEKGESHLKPVRRALQQLPGCDPALGGGLHVREFPGQL